VRFKTALAWLCALLGIIGAIVLGKRGPSLLAALRRFTDISSGRADAGAIQAGIDNAGRSIDRSKETVSDLAGLLKDIQTKNPPN